MTLSLVHDLMILLAAGLVAALVCRRFNVSILIGYLLVGAIVGQGVLGWVRDEGHQLAHFAEVGVFLLLFSIGLEFSIDDLKRLGKNFVIGGLTQMMIVAVPVVLGLRGYGLGWQPSLLIGSAFAFSSTVLVFRTLVEYGQAQTPVGQRAIGILLFQDAALIPLLLMVPLLTGTSDSVGVAAFAQLAGVSTAFVLMVIGVRYALGRWVLPMFANFRSMELVVLFTLVSIGGVTLLAYQIGLPPAVGAFAAGLIFNGNRLSHQIDALVLPFRETFASIFFVGLGLILDPWLLWREPLLFAAVLPLTLLLKAVAATIALKLTGLPWRSALGMGIGLAHIGEFAFVLVLLGADSGVVSESNYQRVVALAVMSLVLTPTLIQFGFRFMRSMPEDSRSGETRHRINDQRRHAVVVGAGPIGGRIGAHLETLGQDVCLLDLSPINLHSFAQQGFRTVAGDATDDAVLQRADVDTAELMVVCVPDDASAVRVVKAMRRRNMTGRLIVRCRFQSNAKKMKKAGANNVVAEESEAAIALVRLLD